MAKVHFRDYNPKQIILFPQRLRHELQTLQALRYGQGQDGLCLLCNCFQHKENVLKINKKGNGKPFGAANTAYFCLLAVLTTLKTTKNGILTKKSG